MTLKQLRDYVQADLGLFGNADFPDIRLNAIINFAQREVQKQLMLLGFKKFEATAQVASFTSATLFGVTCKYFAVSSITGLNENPKGIITIQFTFDAVAEGAANIVSFAYEVEPERFAETCTNKFLLPTIKIPIYTRLNNLIYVYPVSVTGYDLVQADIYYQKTVADLTTDASSTVIPAEFERLIIDVAEAEIKGLLGLQQEKQAKLQEVTANIQNAYAAYVNEQPEKNASEKNERSILQ